MAIKPEDLLDLIDNSAIVKYAEEKIEIGLVLDAYGMAVVVEQVVEKWPDRVLADIDVDKLIAYVAKEFPDDVKEALGIPVNDNDLPDWDEFQRVYRLEGREGVTAMVANRFFHATGIDMV